MGGGGCRLDLGGGGTMVVLFCKKLPQLWEIFLVIREMNDGNLRESFSQIIIPIELCMS